ncbi:hypothetical protein HZ326_7931 [Fusarium oxysporum f. sp. albedinis]|nr:hypothetical protein HZ326_7931 [Fusarium oxysporum f. sp. albedinis]
MSYTRPGQLPFVKPKILTSSECRHRCVWYACGNCKVLHISRYVSVVPPACGSERGKKRREKIYYSHNAKNNLRPSFSHSLGSVCPLYKPQLLSPTQFRKELPLRISLYWFTNTTSLYLILPPSSLVLLPYLSSGIISTSINHNHPAAWPSAFSPDTLVTKQRNKQIHRPRF